MPVAMTGELTKTEKPVRAPLGMRRMIFFLTAAFGFVLSCAAHAHDIPNDVRVHAYLKPSGRELQLLVRVPLTAMREVDFPRRGPGYLDLARADAALREAAALWIADNIEIYEDDTRLAYPRVAAAKVSLPSDKSFASYADALAHVMGPRLPETLDLYWNQGLLDVLLVYPDTGGRRAFSIHPRLARLGLQVVTALQFMPPGGATRAFELHGDPVSSGSIPAGARQRCASSSRVSSTSSKEPITCCSSCAW
jgi:hypothetical protein